MNYLIISFSHKNIDLGMREKLSFKDIFLKENFIKLILDFEKTKEVILLTTCNRVEVIVNSKDMEKSAKDIIEKMALYSKINFDLLFERADIFTKEAAVHHLFTVASALDSLVVGETQIVGQLKDAFKFSQTRGYCSVAIEKIMHYAFKCAASVRNLTSLGTGSVSVASTAVAKIKEISENFKDKKVLVVGAGEMSRLSVKHLISAGYEVTIINRSFNKARKIAEEFLNFVKIESYDKLEILLLEYDIVITATASDIPIITKNIIPNDGKKKYWFDISVPRNIEQIDMENINLFEVDDLQEIVNKNLYSRTEQAKIAYSIVSRMSNEFSDWLKSLQVEPLVKNLYLKGDCVIDKKINLAIKKGFIDKEQEENVRKLCQTIITEYLHNTTKKLKTLSREPVCDSMIENIRIILDFDEKDFFSSCKYKENF